VGERLKPNVVRDFADAQIWILQKVARFLDAGAGDEYNRLFEIQQIQIELLEELGKKGGLGSREI
jgi:hypothetical protein